MMVHLSFKKQHLSPQSVGSSSIVARKKLNFRTSSAWVVLLIVLVSCNVALSGAPGPHQQWQFSRRALAAVTAERQSGAGTAVHFGDASASVVDDNSEKLVQISSGASGLRELAQVRNVELQEQRTGRTLQADLPPVPATRIQWARVSFIETNITLQNVSATTLVSSDMLSRVDGPSPGSPGFTGLPFKLSSYGRVLVEAMASLALVSPIEILMMHLETGFASSQIGRQSASRLQQGEGGTNGGSLPAQASTSPSPERLQPSPSPSSTHVSAEYAGRDAPVEPIVSWRSCSVLLRVLASNMDGSEQKSAKWVSQRESALREGISSGALAEAMRARGLLASAEQVLESSALVSSVKRETVNPVASPSIVAPPLNITGDGQRESGDGSLFFGADVWVVGVMGVVIAAGVVFLAVHLVNQRIAMRNIEEAAAARRAQAVLPGGAGSADIVIGSGQGADDPTPTTQDSLGSGNGAAGNVQFGGHPRPSSREGRALDLEIGDGMAEAGLGLGTGLGIEISGDSRADEGDAEADPATGVLYTPGAAQPGLGNGVGRRAWPTAGSGDLSAIVESIGGVEAETGGVGFGSGLDAARGFDAGPVPAPFKGSASFGAGRPNSSKPHTLSSTNTRVPKADVIQHATMDPNSKSGKHPLHSPTLLHAMRQGRKGSAPPGDTAESMAKPPGVFKSARLQSLVASRMRLRQREKQNEGEDEAGYRAPGENPLHSPSLSLRRRVASPENNRTDDKSSGHDSDWAPPLDSSGQPEKPPTQLAQSDGFDDSMGFVSPLRDAATHRNRIITQGVSSSGGGPGPGRGRGRLQVRAIGLNTRRAVNQSYGQHHSPPQHLSQQTALNVLTPYRGSREQSAPPQGGPVLADLYTANMPIRAAVSDRQRDKGHDGLPDPSSGNVFTGYGSGQGGRSQQRGGAAARSASTQRPRAHVQVQYVEELGNGPSRGRRVQSDPVKDEELEALRAISARRNSKRPFVASHAAGGTGRSSASGGASGGRPASSMSSIGAHNPAATAGVPASELSPAQSRLGKRGRKHYGDVSGHDGLGSSSSSVLSSDDSDNDKHDVARAPGLLRPQAPGLGAGAGTGSQSHGMTPALGGHVFVTPGRAPGGSVVLSPASSAYDVRHPFAGEDFQLGSRLGLGNTSGIMQASENRRAPRGSLSRHAAAGNHGSFPGLHSTPQKAQSVQGPSPNWGATRRSSLELSLLDIPGVAISQLESPTEESSTQAFTDPLSAARSQRAGANAGSVGSGFPLGAEAAVVPDTMRSRVPGDGADNSDARKPARRIGSNLSSVAGTASSIGMHARKTSRGSFLPATSAGKDGSYGEAGMGMGSASGSGVDIDGRSTGGGSAGMVRGRAHTRDLSLDALDDDDSLDGADLGLHMVDALGDL